MLQWIKDRLKERTTWYALATLAGLFGYNVTPEYAGEVITSIMTTVALIEAGKAEKKK